MYVLLQFFVDVFLARIHLCVNILSESPKRILPEKAHFLCEVQYGLDGGFLRLSALVHIVETLHFTITYTAARQRNG